MGVNYLTDSVPSRLKQTRTNDTFDDPKQTEPFGRANESRQLTLKQVSVSLNVGGMGTHEVLPPPAVRII